MCSQPPTVWSWSERTEDGHPRSSLSVGVKLVTAGMSHRTRYARASNPDLHIGGRGKTMRITVASGRRALRRLLHGGRAPTARIRIARFRACAAAAAALAGTWLSSERGPNLPGLCFATIRALPPPAL